MPNQNCPQIKEQFEKILDLKKEFENVFDSKDLVKLEKMMKDLRIKFRNIEEMVGLRFGTVVDYSKPLEKMIKAGKYHDVNKGITSDNFPPENKPESKVSFKIVDFSESMTSEQIITALEKQGLRPATPQELLSFGERYQNKNFEFGLLALGFVWNGNKYLNDNDDGRRIVGLHGSGLKRNLGLFFYNAVWEPERHRFLAVHK